MINEKLYQVLRKLIAYIKHDDNCARVLRRNCHVTCTCGLNAVIKQAKEIVRHEKTGGKKLNAAKVQREKH
jgi:hypothetical protein